ncbi:helix-turn-helix domain-containing protein, partial [Niveispirillum sp.]|uniref:helix-turn-helix domain-containing protein n=1 Tax=Niveispirillum sp. TaxID=1917217 RepID=UPI001B47A58D
MSKNTYDPKHIADTMKKLRESYKLTQENLALSAGLSTRTIEKLESGRHTPEEQTLRSIARALNVDVEIFATPDPEAEAKAKAQLEEALRTKLLVRTEPIRTANDFLKRFGEWEGWRFSFDQVEGDQAMEVAAEIGDWLQDMDGIWELMNTSQRLDTARGFADMCTRLEALGYLCHMGHHKQRMRT